MWIGHLRVNYTNNQHFWIGYNFIFLWQLHKSKTPNCHIAVISFKTHKNRGNEVWQLGFNYFLFHLSEESLEFLFVDTPPGTSDEHLSIVQYMADAGINLSVPSFWFLLKILLERVETQVVTSKLLQYKCTSCSLLDFNKAFCLFNHVHVINYSFVTVEMLTPNQGLSWLKLNNSTYVIFRQVLTGPWLWRRLKRSPFWTWGRRSTFVERSTCPSWAWWKTWAGSSAQAASLSQPFFRRRPVEPKNSAWTITCLSWAKFLLTQVWDRYKPIFLHLVSLSA